MSLIESVHARQILDSRGNPTVEVEVTLENYIAYYTYFRESGYLSLDGKVQRTPYPTPLAVAVHLALRSLR